MSRYTEKELNTLFSQLVKDMAEYQKTSHYLVSVPLEKYPGFAIDVARSPYISELRVSIMFDGQHAITLDYSEGIRGTKKEKEQVVRDCLLKAMSKFEATYQAIQKGETIPPLPPLDQGGVSGGVDGAIKAARAKEAFFVYIKDEKANMEHSAAFRSRYTENDLKHDSIFER